MLTRVIWRQKFESRFHPIGMFHQNQPKHRVDMNMILRNKEKRECLILYVIISTKLFLPLLFLQSTSIHSMMLFDYTIQIIWYYM